MAEEAWQTSQETVNKSEKMAAEAHEHLEAAEQALKEAIARAENVTQKAKEESSTLIQSVKDSFNEVLIECQTMVEESKKASQEAITSAQKMVEEARGVFEANTRATEETVESLTKMIRKALEDSLASSQEAAEKAKRSALLASEISIRAFQEIKNNLGFDSTSVKAYLESFDNMQKPQEKKEKELEEVTEGVKINPSDELRKRREERLKLLSQMYTPDKDKTDKEQD